MLVAPNCSDGDPVPAWLPPGVWYDFWDDTLYQGSRVVIRPAPAGKLPIFVRAGSIMADPAASTAFMRHDRRTIHTYPGKMMRSTSMKMTASPNPIACGASTDGPSFDIEKSKGT